MSVVFLGTSEFAAAILERLAASQAHRPVLVVTRPDRPRGRGRLLGAPPVAERARALGIPLEQPDSVNGEAARAAIAAAGAPPGGQPPEQRDSGTAREQTVVVCAFGALIKEPLLSEHELFNVHPSLLPRWRGAAPIERAILAGDAETGVSIMRLTAGLDSGPVCMAAREPIRAHDTYGTLAARLQELGGELLLRVLDLAREGRPPSFSEQDEGQATYADKILAADRLLDPTRSAEELERTVRALQPHVGARVAITDGALLQVHEAALAEDDRPGPPGLSASGERLLLRCRPGVLELLLVQPPGGRAMTAASYLHGRAAALGA